jgi:hypothetical protein
MKIGSHRVSGPALVVIAAFPVIAGAAFVYLNTYYPAAAERYQPIFPPIAVMVSALTAMLGGFLFATFSIEAQTRNAKVKAAYDAIAKKQWDKDYIAARETYLSIQRKGLDVTNFLSPDDHEFAEAKARCEALRNIMNDYELTAIAIQQKVFDEDFVKLWHRTSMIRDYKILRPYIYAVRSKANSDVIYKEFETLIQRWELDGQDAGQRDD